MNAQKLHLAANEQAQVEAALAHEIDEAEKVHEEACLRAHRGEASEDQARTALARAEGLRLKLRQLLAARKASERVEAEEADQEMRTRQAAAALRVQAHKEEMANALDGMLEAISSAAPFTQQYLRARQSIVGEAQRHSKVFPRTVHDVGDFKRTFLTEVNKENWLLLKALFNAGLAEFGIGAREAAIDDLNTVEVALAEKLRAANSLIHNLQCNSEGEG